MTDDQIVLLIGPTLLLLLAPTSLGQFAQRRRIWRNESLRSAMSTRHAPEHTRGRWLLGIAMAATWAIGVVFATSLT